MIDSSGTGSASVHFRWRLGHTEEAFLPLREGKGGGNVFTWFRRRHPLLVPHRNLALTFFLPRLLEKSVPSDVTISASPFTFGSLHVSLGLLSWVAQIAQ